MVEFSKRDPHSYVFEARSSFGTHAAVQFVEMEHGQACILADLSMDGADNVIERMQPIVASVDDLRAIAKGLLKLAKKIERDAPRPASIVQLREGQPYMPELAPKPSPPPPPVRF